MSTTNNLDLVLHEKGVDPDNGFDDYRDNLNGISDSNMTKVDDFAGTIISFIAASYLNSSASLTPMTTYNNDLVRLYPSNGGFEVSGSGGADIFSSWIETSLVAGGSIVRSSVNPHSGSYCALLSGSGIAIVQYVNSFWSGSSFTLEYWTYGDGLTLSEVSFYDSGGSFLYRNFATRPAYWKRNVATITIPSSPVGMHTCSVLLYGATGGSVAYDDINLWSGGSIATASSALAGIESKFIKLGTFSGSGQADFNGIPQDFSHLLLIGNCSVNTGGGYSFADVGIDFNGDSGSTTYASLQSDYSGSASGSYVQTLAQHQTSQIIIGKVNTTVSEGYNTPFFALIPNYSGSTTSGSYFYKTAMGFSTLSFLQLLTAGIQGGVWLGPSSSAIRRVRVFGSNDSSTRIDFHNYSKIDLYGIQ